SGNQTTYDGPITQSQVDTYLDAATTAGAAGTYTGTMGALWFRCVNHCTLINTLCPPNDRRAAGLVNGSTTDYGNSRGVYVSRSNHPGGVVHAFADGRVVLVPITSIAVPAGRALEVWTLPSRERGPVSVGLMNQARTLQLSLKDLPPPGTDQLFEITLEPATGSPTGRPTGPVLFKGNTALAL
ncbi:MAG: anti-sigma factor, partial [Hyphomicrobiales bacterium]